MKIILTGAHGTGKTTILKEFEKRGMKAITGVVRSLASQEGTHINEEGNQEGQQRIFEVYRNLLSQEGSYISDRGLIDVLAYTIELSKKNKIEESFGDEQLKQMIDWMNEHRDVVYCFVPIEFPIVKDNVRSEDTQYQQDIENNILSIIAALGVGVVILKGTLEERIAKVEELLKWEEEGNRLFSKFTLPPS